MDMDLSSESKSTSSQSRVHENSEIRRRILRMANIKKKMKELSILCDTPAFLIAHYSDGKTETLPENESELMELIARYKSAKKNKSFKYVKRPSINDSATNRTSANHGTTRAERFSKLASISNREVVLRVIQERTDLLKRRRSELQKIGKPENRGEIDTEIEIETTPVNLSEVYEEKIVTPLNYCQFNTEIIMESDYDDDEEEPDQFTKSPPRFDRSKSRPDQFCEQDTVPLTKSPPRADQSEEEVTDQRNKSPPPVDQFSLNYIPIQGTLYVPRNFKIGDNLSEENCMKFPPIFMPQQQQEQFGSSLERDFIAGFDSAIFSTKKLD